MKPLLPITLTVALAGFLAAEADALAGVMSPPSPDIAPVAQIIADQELTISNRYGYANLREKPSSSSKLLARLSQGTKVTFIERVAGGGWVHVKAGEKLGYIRADLLK